MRRCRAWRAKKRSFAGRTPQTSYPGRRNATRNRDKTRTGHLERVFHIHPAFICWIPPFESSPRVSLQLIPSDTPGGTISSQNDRRRAAAKFPRGQSGLGKAPPKFRSSHQRRELPRQTLTQEVIYIIYTCKAARHDRAKRDAACFERRDFQKRGRVAKRDCERYTMFSLEHERDAAKCPKSSLSRKKGASSWLWIPHRRPFVLVESISSTYRPSGSTWSNSAIGVRRTRRWMRA